MTGQFAKSASQSRCSRSRSRFYCVRRRIHFKVVLMQGWSWATHECGSGDLLETGGAHALARGRGEGTTSQHFEEGLCGWVGVGGYMGEVRCCGVSHQLCYTAKARKQSKAWSSGARTPPELAESSRPVFADHRSVSYLRYFTNIDFDSSSRVRTRVVFHLHPATCSHDQVTFTLLSTSVLARLKELVSR